MSEQLATEIETVRFSSVRLREGYEVDDVDAFLDRLAAAARAGESLAPLCASARFTPVRLQEGYDMGEVDAFLDRVSGAGSTSAPAVPAPEVPPAPTVVQEQRGLLDRILHRD